MTQEQALFPQDWLVQRVEDVRALEEEHQYQGRAFGVMNERWEKLKSAMQPGDELWEFRSGDQSWASLAGRAGYVVLRGGREVAALVTMLS